MTMRSQIKIFTKKTYKFRSSFYEHFANIWKWNILHKWPENYTKTENSNISRQNSHAKFRQRKTKVDSSFACMNKNFMNRKSFHILRLNNKLAKDQNYYQQNNMKNLNLKINTNERRKTTNVDCTCSPNDNF